jgi:alpha-L-rhamnosidase
MNGKRADDALFAPGWSDYLRRAYYRTYDVTSSISPGNNTLGFILSDGWYSGYVGYGLLVGYGPNRVGRYFYGRTPALRAQLRLEYADGTTDTVITDKTWQVSGDGPIREADLIMGEEFDAARDDPQWCTPRSGRSWRWEPCIPASENRPVAAVFSDNRGDREVNLGFQEPPLLQAYSAPAIRITQQLKAVGIKNPKPGVYVFDLGQNFAGIYRLRVKGKAGTRVRLRFGEMAYPDGSVMTENLRRARATDTYILRGDPNGETYQPTFTYHGYQFVEITGFPGTPDTSTITGLVVHNDTPLTSEFSCSDKVMTKFWKNTQWTQRANFIEVPTDCPQRDERLGWMGDAQTYVRTAAYNADVAAFFNKWLDDVAEAQQSFGAYPDYCPYPMGHGDPKKTFGTAWTDAGIICPWTIWKVYGDTRILQKMWPSMTKFMEWRASYSKGNLGAGIGNPWGDWLNAGETTSIEFIDTAYYAHDAALMSEMAAALGRKVDAAHYRRLFGDIRTAFNKEFVNADGTLKQDTQTAYALALEFQLLPDALRRSAADRLAAKIEANGYRMTTGFLGTRRILPALSGAGRHDLAVALFQNRVYPSWGYEVINGANTVWERWDSFTREHGFNGLSGNQNAAMNSFSHYSFGAVMEWGFRDLAGIDTDGPGFRKILLRPAPPTHSFHPDVEKINWVKAKYHSPRGIIECHWENLSSGVKVEVVVPGNTTATLTLPVSELEGLTESGRPLAQAEGVKVLSAGDTGVTVTLASGRYTFIKPAAR